MNAPELIADIERRWPGTVREPSNAQASTFELTCVRAELVDLCRWLHDEQHLVFAGLIVEEGVSAWELRYCFHSGRDSGRDSGWVYVVLNAPLEQQAVPSIVEFIHAADWHEREAEDLYGIVFEGHPRLGDFALHNDVWQESVQPMRHRFDPVAAMSQRKPDVDWQPISIVHEQGAFMMPVGPKYSGITESVHFLLETVGEDVIRAIPRLFYKWRAVEKIAEGRTVDGGLLLAERFAATTAFAHGLGYCQAVEAISGVCVPRRAQILRVFLAELERLRHHAAAIEHICESTALAIASSQAAILEEDLLRLSGELTGHRYLFGMLAPGGLLTDVADDACQIALNKSRRALDGLNELEGQLRVASSFLDRLEEVGTITPEGAESCGLVGPMARASGVARDLRRVQPYSAYGTFSFDIPVEQEGDGYARLRILFAEARQSVHIMEQAVGALASGDVCAPFQTQPGAALGWAEAPRGSALHWVRLDEGGRIVRYHVIPPSFSNWLGFHLAVENFAFQDFPIILSTLNLSVTENDR